MKATRGLLGTVVRLATAMALALAITVSPFHVLPVLAHCPGGAASYSYASGGRSIQSATYWANGIEGWIGYTNPNPCTNSSGSAFSTEYVNISRNGSNDGFVQVGWTKTQAYSAPRVKCEFSGTAATGFWHLHHGTGSISATTHKFQFLYTSGTSEWYCRMDGVQQFHTHSASQLGWTQGYWLQSTGETNAVHGQIGANSPSKLGFTVMRYRTTNGLWNTLNITPGSPNAPYGVDEPAAGEMRNWTNAH